MTAVRALQEEFANIGYAAIVRDYVFSDIFLQASPNRKVSIGAFSQTPPSYRNAGLAVVERDNRDAAHIVSEYRALGAPLLFVVHDNDVSVWQIQAGVQSREIARSHVNQLAALFAANRD